MVCGRMVLTRWWWLFGGRHDRTRYRDGGFLKSQDMSNTTPATASHENGASNQMLRKSMRRPLEQPLQSVTGSAR
jgi:hypothetical protein